MMKRRKRKSLEIKFFEDLLQDRPNFTHALESLGNAYTKSGFYQEGLEVDKRLLLLKPEDPIVYYNLACSLSLLGDIDDALKALKRAVVFGYSDYSYMLKDPDLENLRKDPSFSRFFTKIKAVKK
jgi:tetratricopeptide (TPR) repeat protein